VSEAHESFPRIGVTRLGQVELGSLARVGEGTGGGSLGLVSLFLKVSKLHLVILSHSPGILSYPLVDEL